MKITELNIKSKKVESAFIILDEFDSITQEIDARAPLGSASEEMFEALDELLDLYENKFKELETNLEDLEVEHYLQQIVSMMEFLNEAME